MLWVIIRNNVALFCNWNLL